MISFDCYGTLIDWQTGLRGFLTELLARHDRTDIDLREFIFKWERVQFKLLRPYRPYAQVLAQSLLATAREYKLKLDQEEAAGLARAMGLWEPFPDTVPALTQLARKVPIGIISNTDRAIFEVTRKRLGLPLGGVVLAEDVGAYKPDRKVFEVALKQFSIAPGELLHVSYTFEYDHAPARALGIRTAFVRRASPPDEPAGPVDHTFDDLWGLVRTLEN